MANDPYRDNLGPRAVFAKKVPIAGKLVVVMDGHLPKRGLELIAQETRGLSAGDVHELIGSDEQGIGPEKTVNRIAFLGFVEILNGGVLRAGDEMRVGGKLVGRLAGFDYTHMPNHMNIVISVAEDLSGIDRGFELSDPVTFELPA
jgi:hypothetical protein